MLRAKKEAHMEALWTTITFAVVASGALLAAYVLVYWLRSGRR
jgi:hypothetical protein